MIEDYNISAKEMIAFEESTREAVQALAKKRKEGFEALAKQCVPSVPAARV